MKRNISLLSWLLLAHLFLSVPQLQAQEVLALEEPDSTHWEVNTILNPFLTVMLGGSVEVGRNPVGIQLKRHKDENAFRVGIDYDRDQSIFYTNNGLGRVVDQRPDTLVVLQDNFDAHQLRLQFGMERGSTGRVGRVYVGGDVSFAYRYSQYSAELFDYDLKEDRFVFEENLSPPYGNVRHLSAVGVGVKPFIGVERSLNDRFGFNIEGNLDMLAQYQEGYVLRNDATYIRSGNVLTLETYPLLEVRLFYRL